MYKGNKTSICCFPHVFCHQVGSEHMSRTKALVIRFCALFPVWSNVGKCHSKFISTLFCFRGVHRLAKDLLCFWVSSGRIPTQSEFINLVPTLGVSGELSRLPITNQSQSKFDHHKLYSCSRLFTPRFVDKQCFAYIFFYKMRWQRREEYLPSA